MAKKSSPNTNRNDTVSFHLSTDGNKRGTQGKRKRANPKVVCFFFAVVGLAVGIGTLLLTRLNEYEQARKEYEVYARITEAPIQTPALETATPMPSKAPIIAAKATESTAPTPTPRRFYSAKVSALRRDNKDTVGWLTIPKTGIDYPLVQTDNNEYYVEHTFAKKKNASGAIFMDCWNTNDFSDFNTVIYGHNMNDGSMFAGLREYEHQSFAKEHPTIEITQFDAKRTYQVFAAYVSQGEDEADFRGQSAVTEHDRGAFVYEAKKRSLIKSDVKPGKDGRLLTLVTCTSGRHPWYFVVHAVLIEEQLYAE